MAKTRSPQLVMAGPEGHIVSQKCRAQNGKNSVPEIFNDRAQGSHSLSKMQAPIWEKMVPKIGIGMARGPHVCQKCGPRKYRPPPRWAPQPAAQTPKASNGNHHPRDLCKNPTLIRVDSLICDSCSLRLYCWHLDSCSSLVSQGSTVGIRIFLIQGLLLVR